jgi:hypothetical protein
VSLERIRRVADIGAAISTSAGGCETSSGSVTTADALSAGLSTRLAGAPFAGGATAVDATSGRANGNGPDPLDSSVGAEDGVDAAGAAGTRGPTTSSVASEVIDTRPHS